MNDLIKTSDDLAQLGKELLQQPQVHCPLAHLFAPGVYYREIFMPAGTCVIGKEHLTEHVNIVLSGEVEVFIGVERKLLIGPCTFVSKPGARKALNVIKDTRWVTIHPTDCTDVNELERTLVVGEDIVPQLQQQNQSFVYTAVAGVVIGLIGTGVSAYGAVSSADAQQDAANYNAKLEQNNADAAAQQAKFDAQQISDRTRRNVAQQRAAMAASGFDANTGTFADITQSTKQSGELDRLARIYQGRLGVSRSESQSVLDVMNGQNAHTAGMISAGSTVLGGIGSSATTISSNPSFRN